MIKPYLRDMINDHKTRREWKIQLTMRNNFISHKDSEETGTMYIKKHNIKIMKCNDVSLKLSKNFLNLFYKIIKKV